MIVGYNSVQYIPRNMHTVFALLCFVVVIHWLISPYPSGLLHWHCGNLTIAPVPAKQPWWIWINTSCEFIMNDCITTTKQSTTKPCAYTVHRPGCHHGNYNLGVPYLIKSSLCSSSTAQELRTVDEIYNSQNLKWDLTIWLGARKVAQEIAWLPGDIPHYNTDSTSLGYGSFYSLKKVLNARVDTFLLTVYQRLKPLLWHNMLI